MRTRHAAPMMSLALAIVAIAFCVAPAAAEQGHAHGVSPPQSNAYGNTLTGWMTTYLRWMYSGADPAQSIVGHVKMLPLPAGAYVSGDGTLDSPALYVGQLEITLPPGTPFVLPLGIWTVERYEGYPGVPDDLPIPDGAFLAGVSPSLIMDGKEIVSDSNKAARYVPLTTFDPIVVYPTPSSYGSVAAVAFQGYGIVSQPLSVGTHVIHLYEPYLIEGPPYTIGVIYDNTWIVKVTPH